MQTQMYTHEQLKSSFPDQVKISEIIAELERNFWATGSVICEIHINGKYVTEEEETILSTKGLEDIITLEILTRDQNELIEVTLRTMNQWIPKLKERALWLSQQFKLGQSSPPQDFIELIDGCKWLSDSLLLLKPTLLKLIGTDAFEQQWSQIEMLFSSTAKEVLQSYEREDHVLVSDILEFDLGDALGQWQGLLFSESKIRTISKV